MTTACRVVLIIMYGFVVIVVMGPSLRVAASCNLFVMVRLTLFLLFSLVSFQELLLDMSS